MRAAAANCSLTQARDIVPVEDTHLLQPLNAQVALQISQHVLGLDVKALFFLNKYPCDHVFHLSGPHSQGTSELFPRAGPPPERQRNAGTLVWGGAKNWPPCPLHCNTRGQFNKALIPSFLVLALLHNSPGRCETSLPREVCQSFLFFRSLRSSWGETLPISPMERATLCLMGFHSMLPNTATSMAMPKENTKKGKVKE